MVRWRESEQPRWCSGKTPDLSAYQAYEKLPDDNKPEKTVRLRFEAEPTAWLPFGDDVEKLLEKVDALIAPRIMLEELYTPLIEALDDVYYQDYLRDVARKNATFLLAIISDGVQDPCNQLSSPGDIEEGSSEADIVRRFLRGDPASPGSGYSLIKKLQVLKERAGVKSRMRLEGNFRDAKDAPHWIRRELEKDDFKKLVSPVDVTDEHAAGGAGEAIDPAVIHHSDSLLGNQADGRRTAAGAAKRVVILRSTGLPAPLPLAWGGGVEAAYAKTIESPKP
jgi:hypothetical protein